MTPREIVKRTILFEKPSRLACDLPEQYYSDLCFSDMHMNPDIRPHHGRDEWGCVWENIGISNLGEVKHFPIDDWSKFDKSKIPDIKNPDKWIDVAKARSLAGDKFLIGIGISLYERVHFLRGLENTWLDIHENPDKLSELIDVLVEMNIYAIKKYAEAGFDGYLFCDDWPAGEAYDLSKIMEKNLET